MSNFRKSLPLSLLILASGLVLRALADSRLLDDAPARPSQKLTCIEDPANIVGRELLGTWRSSAPLQSRINAPGEGEFRGRLSFRADRAASVRALAALNSWRASAKGAAHLFSPNVQLTGRCVLEGELGTTSYDFALLTFRGNPSLFGFSREVPSRLRVVLSVAVIDDSLGRHDRLFVVPEDQLFGDRYRKWSAFERDD